MSMMKSLMEEFHALAEDNKDDFEVSSLFEQFVSYANNGHQMTPTQLLSYLDNMVEIVSPQNSQHTDKMEEIQGVLDKYRAQLG